MGSLSLDLLLFLRAANVFETVVSSDMMLKLRWSDTDNYYMNMGVDTGKLAFKLLMPREVKSSASGLRYYTL